MTLTTTVMAQDLDSRCVKAVCTVILERVLSMLLYLQLSVSFCSTEVHRGGGGTMQLKTYSTTWQLLLAGCDQVKISQVCRFVHALPLCPSVESVLGLLVITGYSIVLYQRYH